MTLHVRVVTPPDVTERLVDVLAADSGVSNVVVLTGSARRPDGDAVHFDVLTRSATRGLVQKGMAPIWDVVEAKIRSEASYAPRRRPGHRQARPARGVWGRRRPDCRAVA